MVFASHAFHKNVKSNLLILCGNRTAPIYEHIVIMSLQRLAYGEGSLYSPFNKSSHSEYESKYVCHSKSAYWSTADNSDVKFRRKKSECENKNAAILTSLRRTPSDSKTASKNMNSKSHSNIPLACSRGNKNQTRKGSLKHKQNSGSHGNIRLSTSDISCGNHCDLVDAQTEAGEGFWLNTSLTSSIGDVGSVCSMTSSGISSTIENTSTRQRKELRRGSSAVDCVNGNMTPVQMKEKELKDLRTQFTLVSQELEEKDRELAALRESWEADKKQQLDERQEQNDELEDLVRLLDLKVGDLEERLRKSEADRKKEEENAYLAKEELTKLETKCAELEGEMAAKEERFMSQYLDTYRKGLEAARFEREEELETLLSKKSPVTMEELGRKLSRTEKQLGKWQSLRLAESYYQNRNNLKPEGQAGATLALLKDSFYHFLCDPQDSEIHLKAILGMFSFTDSENVKVKKAIADRKKSDKKKLFKKKDRT